MNREIRFRVWDKRDELQKIYYNVYFIPYGEGWNGGNPEYKFYDINFGLGGFMKVAAKEVEIMQYIGLKDKNGKEIYEGDIIEIKHPYKDRMFSGVVSWEGYMWSCKEFYFTHFDIPSDIFSEGTEHIEIIGNIYMNHELLKNNLQ